MSVRKYRVESASGASRGTAGGKRQRVLASVFLASSVLSAATPLKASEWVVGDGDWFTACNWSDCMLPSVQASAYIRNGGKVTIASGDAVAGTLQVGDSGGSGTLTFSGGSLNSGNAAIENGVMTVTGRGTEWDLTNPRMPVIKGQIDIGKHGTGVLVVSGGAKVLNVGGVTIAPGEGDSGTLTLTGIGTTLAVEGTVNIGGGIGGAGTVTISERASFSTASSFNVGTFDGGTGTVVVTGNGSSLTAARLTVGYRGSDDERSSGSLTISDGAVVNATEVLQITRSTKYSGTTGTVNIGAAEGEAAAAAGTINSANGIFFGDGEGILAFNHTESNYDFSHVMTNSETGTATIRQLAGVTTLSGDSSAFTGSTEVTGGTLLVNGALGGTLSASGSGVLGGVGTIGSATIASGGALAPGLRNAIGTLTVNGDLTFESGSSYAVDLTGAASDLVSVSGKATLNGGTVRVRSLDDSTSYQQSQTYTILSAGSLDGSFEETLSTSAFLDVATTYEGNDARLTVTLIGEGEGEGGDDGGSDGGGDNGGDGGGDDGGADYPGVFTPIAETKNQYAVAQALDSLDQSGDSLALYNSMLMLGVDEALETYEQLSGVVYASGQSALMQNALTVNAVINNHLRGAAPGSVAPPSTDALGYAEEPQADPTGDFPVVAEDGFDEGRFAVWGSGLGTWGKIDGTDGSSDADLKSGGFLLGADMLANDMWRFGVAAGYTRSSFDIDQSSGESDDYILAAYAGMELNGFAVRSGLGYTWHNAKATRGVPALDQTLTGEYDADSFNAFGELAYNFDLGPAAVEPFANLSFVQVKTDGFTETGGTGALTVDGQTMNATFTTIGLRAATDFDFGGVATSARGALGWMHAFGDVDTETTARFATGNDFTVFGTPLDRNTAIIEAGLDFQVTESATIGIGYAGQFGENARDQGLNADLRVRF
ncbi:Extracellular serine protease precursor [Martelella mediterranea DSM 17316]|uniref:Extracellular serine protease n=1 Tax=Martelella mediterranea DSM 17316 TaxID=1122214 RepID=A0A1U9Z3H1_9HYPH|nr:Extracellular serine protease precursor [Martelella mediterranea DSM 17316]